MQGTDLLQRFRELVSCNQLWQEGDKLLLALSGGLDSVVLFDLLCRSGAQVEVAHINFGLRGNESDEDAAWCAGKKFASADIYKKMLSQIKVHIASFNTMKEKQAGESIQMTARRLRYTHLHKLRLETDSNYILTAHHLNDQLETVLYNLAKGTGLKGLSGMSMKSDVLLRPLLPFMRAEIESYATMRQLNWREDASNAGIKYKRNRIRHRIIPELKNINPSLEDAFEKSRRHFAAAQHALDYFCENWLAEHLQSKPSGTFLEKQAILDHPCKEILLYHWLSPYGYNDTQLQNILQVSQAGKHFDSETHRLYAEQNGFLLTKQNDEQVVFEAWIEEANEGSIALPNGKLLYWQSLETTDAEKTPPNIARLDAGKLTWPICIRLTKTGDAMKPLGMQGKRKLISNILTDQKVPVAEKKQVLVLESNHQIAWLIGFRISEAFKIDSETQKVIEFRVM